MTRTRDIVTKGDDQCYARVLKMLGDRRLLAKCDDGIERKCRICGRMKKREWISVGDVVLVCLRDLGPSADIVYRYSEAELKTLRLAIPDDTDDDDNIEFRDSDSDPDINNV